MKSEQRHQLESNELADWIVRAAEFIRSWWKYLIGGLAVFVLAYAGIQYTSGASARKLKEAWIDYFGANNPGQYEAVADRHAGLVVSHYARLRAADLRFDEARRELLSDYSGASLKLDKVVQSYDKLAGDANAPLEVRRQASLGKALALETQGNLSTAKSAYERVANNVEFAGTAEALHAQDRLKKLEEPLTKRFYDQLARYEPPAQTGAGGLGGMPELPPPAPMLAPGSAKPEGSEKGVETPLPPIMPLVPDFEKVDAPAPPKKSKEKAPDAAKPSKPVGEKAEKTSGAKPAPPTSEPAKPKEPGSRPSASKAEKDSDSTPKVEKK